MEYFSLSVSGQWQGLYCFVHFIILCTSLWFSGGANSAGIHSADDPAEEAHERQRMPTTDGGHGGVAPRSKAESDAWCWA